MDKSVVLWDVTSGNFTRKWRGHQVEGSSEWRFDWFIAFFNARCKCLSVEIDQLIDWSIDLLMNCLLCRRLWTVSGSTRSVPWWWVGLWTRWWRSGTQSPGARSRYRHSRTVRSARNKVQIKYLQLLLQCPKRVHRILLISYNIDPALMYDLGLGRGSLESRYFICNNSLIYIVD